MNSCRICQRIDQIRDGREANLLVELSHGWLIAGDHQAFEGYCVLLSKSHARELHHLPKPDAMGLYENLLRVSQRLEQSLAPRKLNLVSLGNVDPHVHWHLFPRYENDPRKNEHPWVHSERFSLPTTVSQVTALKRIFSP